MRSIEVVGFASVGLLICAALLSVQALNITECNVTQSNDSYFIVNVRPNCNHSHIYCNGQASMFCDSANLNQCNASYICAEATTPNPTTIRPTTSSSTSTPPEARPQCELGVTRKFSYPKNCNYFYYCIEGYLLVSQCPFGYAFEVTTGSCSGRIENC